MARRTVNQTAPNRARQMSFDVGVARAIESRVATLPPRPCDPTATPNQGRAPQASDQHKHANGSNCDPTATLARTGAGPSVPLPWGTQGRAVPQLKVTRTHETNPMGDLDWPQITRDFITRIRAEREATR